jgi:hypothetical protein
MIDKLHTHEEWHLANCGGVNVLPSMTLIIEEVARALDDGLYYNKDVFERVTSRLHFTDELLKSGLDRVERGNVGMEIYYARHALQCERSRIADREAFERRAFKIGDTFKQIRLNSQKFSTATLTEVQGPHSIALHLKKRGTHNYWTCSVPARVLDTSITESMNK